jgi:uncharacterized membrane protein YedE/YeeE
MAGTAIGLYVLLHYWVTSRALGCSSAFGSACALGSSLPYFRGEEFGRAHDWRMWFMLGTPVGGLIGATSSPGDWQASFAMGVHYDAWLPESLWGKALTLFGAGALMGIGARMAGGCTSGHTIVGVALLTPSSLLASIGFFIGALATVQALAALLGGAA